jgi:hypothetical protein
MRAAGSALLSLRVDKIVLATFHQNVVVSPDCLIGTPEISGLLATGRMNRDTSPA